MNKELELNKVYQMDCLEGMKLIPDDSVNLIAIDPPYNIGKDKRWDKWETVERYVEWMTDVFKECERVLAPNGSFYWWHNEINQVRKLMDSLDTNTSFVFKQLITINKPKFKVFAWKNRTEKAVDRNWFPNVEYCLFYTFQDESGSSQAAQDAIRDYLCSELEKFGKASDINRLFWANGWAKTGSNIATHFFGKNNQNCLPTLQNYQRLQTTGFFSKPYELLKQEYEKKRYVFNKDENLSCVWEFNESNSGKFHPTQKPLTLIEKIIRASSNEGDVVLDCFMGSGTTAIAALKNKREFIGFERENEYIKIANQRLEDLEILHTTY